MSITIAVITILMPDMGAVTNTLTISMIHFDCTGQQARDNHCKSQVEGAASRQSQFKTADVTTSTTKGASGLT